MRPLFNDLERPGFQQPGLLQPTGAPGLPGAPTQNPSTPGQMPGQQPGVPVNDAQQLLEQLMGAQRAENADLFRQNQIVDRGHRSAFLQKHNPAMALMQSLDPNSFFPPLPRKERQPNLLDALGYGTGG